MLLYREATGIIEALDAAVTAVRATGMAQSGEVRLGLPGIAPLFFPAGSASRSGVTHAPATALIPQTPVGKPDKKALRAKFGAIPQR
jgi:hypothetical protein